MTQLTLDQKTIDEIAHSLDHAEREREQIKQLSLTYPEMTIADAYAIQRAWVTKKIARGEEPRGHKIGLTSRAMQRASNITEPDYGQLLSPMIYQGGDTIDISQFIMPRVEVELAFILNQDLQGPHCTIFNVLEATEWVFPALEIIDARIEPIDAESGVTRKVVDTIADNAANAGVVLGGRPARPEAINLRQIWALLYRNGVIEDSGVSAAVLDHPANGVAWLVNQLHQHGEILHAEEIILSGAFTSPIPATSGDTFHVEFAQLGAITCNFK